MFEFYLTVDALNSKVSWPYFVFDLNVITSKEAAWARESSVVSQSMSLTHTLKS